MHRAVVLALSMLCAGCLVSEQQGTVHTLYNPNQDGSTSGEFTIHFDNAYNKGVVFGRSALLALLGLWFVSVELGCRTKTLTLVLGAPALAASAWLLNQDLPTLLRYRINVRAAGLRVEIPPAAAREIVWDQLQGMTVLGHEFPRLGSRDPRPRLGPRDLRPENDSPVADIADWRTLDLRLAGGEVLKIDLSRLSLEQRITVFRAIAMRARLVEVAR